MNLTSKLFVTTALGLAAALGAGGAQAREAEVQWSVTVGTPVVVAPVIPYGRSAPVYGPPAAVYAQPAQVYVQPAPVGLADGYRQPTRWDVDGDGIPNRYDRLYNPRWDRDGDGIPDRYERVRNPRWDRDGDGVPNRHDHYDNGPRDRDRDGIPDRFERYDGQGRRLR